MNDAASVCTTCYSRPISHNSAFQNAHDRARLRACIADALHYKCRIVTMAWRNTPTENIIYYSTQICIAPSCQANLKRYRLHAYLFQRTQETIVFNSWLYRLNEIDMAYKCLVDWNSSRPTAHRSRASFADHHRHIGTFITIYKGLYCTRLAATRRGPTSTLEQSSSMIVCQKAKLIDKR